MSYVHWFVFLQFPVLLLLQLPPKALPSKCLLLRTIAGDGKVALVLHKITASQPARHFFLTACAFGTGDGGSAKARSFDIRTSIDVVPKAGAALLFLRNVKAETERCFGTKDNLGFHVAANQHNGFITTLGATLGTARLGTVRSNRNATTLATSRRLASRLAKATGFASRESDSGTTVGVKDCQRDGEKANDTTDRRSGGDHWCVVLL